MVIRMRLEKIEKRLQILGKRWDLIDSKIKEILDRRFSKTGAQWRTQQKALIKLTNRRSYIMVEYLDLQKRKRQIERRRQRKN